ncbi:MAG: hypothetical protein QOD69_1055 [Solirubrobacteraceae bacterium]|nr:hypothetical protein [Solirubrobacteraceae bacterium]
MTPRPLALTCALGAALVAAPAASAATLATDTSCYQETQEVVLNGAGYTPGSTVTVMRDGAALGTATTDAGGGFQRKFVTPEIAGGLPEAGYSLTASDAVNTATTNYRATKVFADFSPGSGDPRRLRVRFTVAGFGLARPAASVYLHYVRKSTGQVRKTIRLGTARGTCGAIAQTKKRRLFPFAPQRGTWILQFDTLKHYERATGRRTTPWVRKPVEVFARKG